MSNPRIHVASLDEARRLLSSPEAGNFTSIISISDGGEMTAPLVVRKAAFAEKLLMFFDDLEVYTQGYSAPTEEDIWRIIQFARSIQGSEGECLIHCMAGISRSSAAAIIVKTVWVKKGSTPVTSQEIESLVAEIFSEFPNSSPNLLMVKLADDLLKLNGELIRTVKRFTPWRNHT